jgi:hypothetical protein
MPRWQRRNQLLLDGAYGKVVKALLGQAEEVAGGGGRLGESDVPTSEVAAIDVGACH